MMTMLLPFLVSGRAERHYYGEQRFDDDQRCEDTDHCCSLRLAYTTNIG